jgi:hypothetical protein
MDDLTRLDADAILAIPDDRPGFLFSGDPATLASEFRTQIKRWHPDACLDPRADEVATKITKLRDSVNAALDRGVWWGSDIIQITGSDRKTRRIVYAKHFKTDLGETCYGRSNITLMVDKKHSSLFADGLRTINSLPYPTPEIKNEMARYMPRVRADFEARDGTMVLVIEKTPDVYRLRDLISALGGSIEPKHVAWMMNTVLNIACYLERAGLTHNAITPDSFFVSPKYHSGLLLGDWWFAAKAGQQMLYLPAATHALAPADIIKSKTADCRLDLMSARALGRTMLGDPTGMSLLVDSRMPRRMVDWLRASTRGRAVDDYREWSTEVLPACFGQRKFIKLDLTDAQVFASP